MPEMKICFRCRRSLPIDKVHFHANRTKKNGFESTCKECLGLTFEQKTIAKEGYKFCSKCKRELPADIYHFHISNKAKSGFVERCKECRGMKFTEPIQPIKEGYKKCGHCGIILPSTSEYFFRDSHKRDGLQSSCKSCSNEIQDNYHKRHPGRNFYNPEKVRRYYLENKDKIIGYAKIYRSEHSESIHEYQVKYREKNPDKIKVLNKRWQRQNPEKALIYKQKRRSIKDSLPATLTVAQWEEIKQSFDNKCAYCGKEESLQQDHFVPLGKGGEYSHNNIIPACRFCNMSKKDRDFNLWYPKFRYYSKARERKILRHLGYKSGIQQLTFA